MACRIVALEAHHRRDAFDCGDLALNSFFSRVAGQQQRKGFGRTYVALSDSDHVPVGFVTVSAGQVATHSLPAALHLPRYPVPILRIGRLAVDLRYQRLGIGRDLLAFALQLAVEFSARVGLYAVLVDAKDERAAEFYRRLSFIATLDNPLCLFLPLSVLNKTSGAPKS